MRRGVIGEGSGLELCYVVLNPVRAGITRRPADYAWSSFRATIGRAAAPAFLERAWLLGQFADDPRAAQEAYRCFVLDGIGRPAPWQALKAQALLGSDAFVERLAPLLADAETSAEVPRPQRRLAQASLSDLLAGAEDAGKPERDRLIAAAHLDGGYMPTEIARHLGLHVSTVSKILTAKRSGTTSLSKT